MIVGEELFAAAMIGFACVGIAELFKMVRSARPFALVAYAAAAALVAAALYGGQFQMVIVLAATIPAVRRGLLRPDRGVTVSIALTILGVIWIAVPFAHAVLLRELPDRRGAARRRAHRDLRRRHGRVRRRPAVRPPPAGARAVAEQDARGWPSASSAAHWGSGSPACIRTPPRIDALLMGMCVAALACVGDLFESMIKRDLRIKTRAPSSAPTAACSTASTRRCSRSSPATTWRSRWCTERESSRLPCRCPRSSCSSRQSRLHDRPALDAAAGEPTGPVGLHALDHCVRHLVAVVEAELDLVEHDVVEDLDPIHSSQPIGESVA